MKIGFEVFLAVARELSITKAANELHITQQCTSDHIKRLEKEYNVVLFKRRPKFSLTQAGEIMLRNLLNIQIMEMNMSKSLAEIGGGNGQLYIGYQHLPCSNHTATCTTKVLSVLSRC